MDATNKKYYEDIMADFNKFRHGRNLYQFCRDERIDYQWLLSLKRQYNYEKTHPAIKDEDNLTKEDFIEVSLTDEQSDKVDDNVPKSWKIEQLVIASPDGETIEIKSSNLQTVLGILIQISSCHV